MLDPKEELMIKRVKSMITPMIIFGFLLIILSASYSLWAIAQVDPSKALNPKDAFDRPVSRLALIGENRFDTWLNQVEAQTKLEISLVIKLIESNKQIGRLILLLTRIVIGLFLFNIGIMILIYSLSWKESLKMIDKLKTSS